MWGVGCQTTYKYKVVYLMLYHFSWKRVLQELQQKYCCNIIERESTRAQLRPASFLSVNFTIWQERDGGLEKSPSQSQNRKTPNNTLDRDKTHCFITCRIQNLRKNLFLRSTLATNGILSVHYLFVLIY